MTETPTQTIQDEEQGQEEHLITETIVDEQGNEQITRIQITENHSSQSTIDLFLTDWVYPVAIGAVSGALLVSLNILIYEMLSTNSAIISLAGSVLLIIEVLLIYDAL